MYEVKKYRISSLETVIHKFVFTAVSCIAACGLLFLCLSGGNVLCWFGFLFMLCGSAYIFWTSAKLKAVAIENGHLIISNYLKEIKVPVVDIEHILEEIYPEKRVIKLWLKHDSIFGKEIVFIPKREFVFWENHSTAKLLQDMIQHYRKKS